MRYFLVVLLIAGCSSSPADDSGALPAIDPAIRQTCDSIVGPPRDSMYYLTCVEMEKEKLK